MRGLKRSPWLFGLGVLLAVLVVYGGHARADVTTDQAGSMIIFPKVVADGTRDTLVTISNTSNSNIGVHCVYINAAGSCNVSGAYCNLDADCPSLGPNADPQVCVHQCTEHNFSFALTKQQPTGWEVSTGRKTGDMPGIFVGQVPGQFVPPSPEPFVGELKCIQVDANGDPTSANALKGEAIIFNVAPAPGFQGSISEYNALSFRMSGAASDPPSYLTLNQPAGGTTGQFNACPTGLWFNATAEGKIDPITGATVSTELSLAPCTELIEQAAATHVVVQFDAFNEFEQRISQDAYAFDCYANLRLHDISIAFGGTLQTDAITTRITVPANRKMCYTGDARCHLCGQGLPVGAVETDPACYDTNGHLTYNVLVGNCDCTTDADCPNFQTSVGAGTSHPLGCLPVSGVVGVTEEFQSLTPPSGLPSGGTSAANMFMEGNRASTGGDIMTIPGLGAP